MAKSRGKMLAEQAKRGVVVAVVEDKDTKQALVKQLTAVGIGATMRESMVNLKKKLAVATTEGE